MPLGKLLTAAVGTVVGAALLTSPAAAAPAAVDCAAYRDSQAGSFRPGYESGPWSYFWTNGPDTFAFCVDIPDTAEVTADLRAFDDPTQQWKTVLTAPAGPGDKEFTYRAAGSTVYRLVITGVDSSGTYLAGFTRG